MGRCRFLRPRREEGIQSTLRPQFHHLAQRLLTGQGEEALRQASLLCNSGTLSLCLEKHLEAPVPHLECLLLLDLPANRLTLLPDSRRAQDPSLHALGIYGFRATETVREYGYRRRLDEVSIVPHMRTKKFNKAILPERILLAMVQ